MNRKTGFKFPALPNYQSEGNNWMTNDQERLNVIYGWTSLLIAIGACMYVSIRFAKYIKSRVHNAYQVRMFLHVFTNWNNHFYYIQAIGEDQGIAFSQVASISSYIPQVKSDEFPYPLIAFDTLKDGISEDLFEWKDPEKPYLYYDMTKDVKDVFMGTGSSLDVNSKCLFSRVKHWPLQKDLAKNESEEEITSKDENLYVIDSPNGQWRYMATMIRN